MTELRFLTAGESHGKGLTVIVEGLPAGLPLTEKYMERDLRRRQGGHGRSKRQQIEQDHAEITGGGSTIKALVINRLPTTPKGVVPGNLLTRAVVVERDGAKWKEVFRCDEYLKNPNGFMGGTPLLPITGWRLQFERSAERGLVMYFTPLQMPGGGHTPTIGVRWNAKAKRYQSLDRNFENFLGEVPTLEKIPTRLR